MRFGIFYEHQQPRPWEDGSTERLLGDALDQVELADRLGFDYVWEVEHHFLEEYSHSSAPEVFLGAASQRTKRILLAARKGLGALSFSFIEPEDAREWVDEYYEILESEECVPAGFSVNPNFAVVLPMMIHDDEAEAIERGIDGAHFFGYSLAHYYVFGEHEPGRTDVWAEFQRDRAKKGFAREIVNPDKEPLGVK